MKTMIALFITYRPLLWALVAFARAAIAATRKNSAGGRYIAIEERPSLNAVLWKSYDAWVKR